MTQPNTDLQAELDLTVRVSNSAITALEVATTALQSITEIDSAEDARAIATVALEQVVNEIS